jgi:hypothetical protein
MAHLNNWNADDAYGYNEMSDCINNIKIEPHRSIET